MQLTNHAMQSNFIGNWNMRCNYLKCGKYARDRELTFLTGSRSFFLEWGCFLLFHLGVLVKIRIRDDEFEDGSFFLRHLFLFFFFLTDFSGSSIGFGFFILILFGCFLFSCFSSKRGYPEAKANISFLPAKWNWICPEAIYMQAFAVLRKGRPRIKGVASALPMSKIIKYVGI